MVEGRIATIVITVVVLLIVLGLLYLALEREGEGELVELAIELTDRVPVETVGCQSGSLARFFALKRRGV